MNLRNIILCTCLIMAGFVAISGTNAEETDLIVGTWTPSDGRSRIKIEKIGSKYFGRIVWLIEPDDPATKKPKLDKNNPDTTLRKAPVKGLRILKDFTYKGSKEWGGGTIYDPKNGKTYSCVINIKEDDNKMSIRGYVGIKTFGRTDTWTRYTEK